MSRFFYGLLLPLSVTGSVAVLLLCGLQAALFRMGKRPSGLLAWRAASLFFLLPLPPLLALGTQGPAYAVEQGPQALFHAVSGPTQALASGALRLAALSPLAALFSWLPFLWLAGFLVSCIALALRLHRFSRRIAEQRIPPGPQEQALLLALCGELHLSKRLRVYRLPRLRSPFACGLLRPTIYLPQRALPPQAAEWALRHELLHIQRGHLWAKAAAEGIALLHWFGPLTAVLKKRLDTACELDCDLCVTRGLRADERKAYAALLLALAEPAPTGSAQALSRQGKQLSLRLQALRQPLTHRQRRLLGALLALLLLLPGLPVSALCESTAQSAAAGTALLNSALAHPQDFLPSASAGAGSLSAPQQLIRLAWPIPGHRYCSRVQSTGLSIVAQPDTPILAAADGVVLATSDSSGEIGDCYGQTVILVHGTNPDISTCYTHCETLYVQPGDAVRAGQVIAAVGDSGDVSGPMCRYQVCIDGILYDPAQWYPDAYLSGDFSA